MEIIDTYLDNVFSKYPRTQRAAEVKQELRAMMEDTYSGALAAGKSSNEALGQAIAEFGTLEELDGLVEGNATGPGPLASPAEIRPGVTLKQYENYAATMRRTRWLLGLGVALLVFSPVPLVALTLLSESPTFALGENLAITIGLFFLLPLVGTGVGMLVWRSQQLVPFQKLQENYEPLPQDVLNWAERIRSQNSTRWTTSLVVGIALWIISALPLIGASLLSESLPPAQASIYLAFGMTLTLTLVAAGLLIFLPSTWSVTISNLVENRAAGGGPTSDMDRYPTWARALLSGFWPIIVAIYLAWSFIWNAWDISWIIYPIAGVSFAALAAILSVTYPERR